MAIVHLLKTINFDESPNQSVKESLELPSVGTPLPNGHAPLRQEKQEETSSLSLFHRLFRKVQKLPVYVEEMFFFLGGLVGRNPKATISMTLIISACFTVGLVQLHDENNDIISSVAENNQLRLDYEFYLQNISHKEEYHKFIVEADNVLDSATLKKIWNLHKQVLALATRSNYTYEDICVRLSLGCASLSLFDLWLQNDYLIENLENSSILKRLNQPGGIVLPFKEVSFPLNMTLGGIQYATNGSIISARAMQLFYTTRNSSKKEDWEEKFIKLGVSHPFGLNVYVEASSSFLKELAQKLGKSFAFLVGGFFVVFGYIVSMTGSFTKIGHSVSIAFAGILATGLAIGSGFGLCSVLGFVWDQYVIVSPFVVLAIGIDDMFIILQTWKLVNNDSNFDGLKPREKSPIVLKMAGPSILVTTMTDVLAIGLSASSEYYITKVISVFIIVGLSFLLVFECTFYMACCVLNQERKEAKRDAFLCCLKVKEDDQICADKQIFDWVFENVVGYWLELPAIRYMIIIVTIAMTSVMAWGFSGLKVDLRYQWYFPKTSYYVDFIDKSEAYFKWNIDVTVFVTGGNIYEQQDKIEILYETLSNNSGVGEPLYSWYNAYCNWPQKQQNLTEVEFYDDVNRFVNSLSGFIFAPDVFFSEDGKNITGFKFRVFHAINRLDGLKNLKIKTNIIEDINHLNFSSRISLISLDYFYLDIIGTINREFYRNLGITFAGVFLMILPALGSFQVGLWVFVGVVLTLVQMLGAMYFSGLFVDAVSTVCVLLTVGVSVDYLSHIGHKFLTLSGTRLLRMRATLSDIGPAVFNGAFSSFIAVLFINGAGSYGFTVVFMMVSFLVAFGIWNSLLFLPSVLGSIGPKPHATASKAVLSERAKIRKNV